MATADKKILFICWDNPSVTYLEGLFAPIFEVLVRDYNYQFVILQFSWASDERISFLQSYCSQRGILFYHHPVALKPIPAIGKYFTLRKAIPFLKKFIREHGITTVMPRSTMPAKMVLSLLKSEKNLKVIFDADGLPIEERVDFANLRAGSFRHRTLKEIEKRIIEKAALVLTRTSAAAGFLQRQYNVKPDKFSVVKNGSNADVFRVSLEARSNRRKELGIPEDSRVFVYSGSMGPQYGLEQMLYIFAGLNKADPNTYFLILTNNPDYLVSTVQAYPNVIVRRTIFQEIPSYLSAADVAFAIRKATFSMKGVAPIKIGEYLLMGLPVIASADIGDSNDLFFGRSFVFLLSGYEQTNLDKAVSWAEGMKLSMSARSEIRAFAEANFTVEKSAESYSIAIGKVL